ncbi:MAG: hypothetical protein U0524_00170 [Candidatus Saccharimonadales bacterium]
MWQDYVLAVGAFFFSIALIPSLRGSQKPAVLTSVLTAITLAIFAVTFVTLDLWLSAIAEAIGVLCWGALAAQVMYQNRKR